MSVLDYRSGDKIAEAIDRRIVTVAKQVYDKSPNNKTKYGKVLSKKDGLFTIEIEKSIYTKVPALRNVGNINIGEIVVCMVPNNQFSNIMILGVADGTIVAPSSEEGGASVNVVDNLNSTSSTDALSANQGRVVNEKIVNINSSIENIESKLVSKTSELTNDGEDGTSPFATEDFVARNGGKIDSISLNGNNQVIDDEKNVNIIITTDTIGAATKEQLDQIKEVIPNQATAQNQLADKDFVNSSIETATATFKGTFKNLDTLKATQADKNDYAFYDHYVADNRTFDRYKYNGTQWEYEYSLNNSSFTDAQWKAINSGATAELINKILVNEAAIQSLQASKANQASLDETNQTVSTMKTKLDTIESGAEVNKVDSVNGKTGELVLSASDVGALADTIKYGSGIEATISHQNYTIELQLKDQDGNNIGKSFLTGLPIYGGTVVKGEYRASDKRIVLTYFNNNSMSFSLEELISGLQSEITESNKLSVNLISGLSTIATSGNLSDATQDANNRTVTDAEKITWNNKVDSVNGKTGDVQLNATDVGALPSDTPLFSGNYNDLSNKPTLFSGDYNDLTNKPTIPTNNNQLTNGAGYITASRPAGAGIEFKSKDTTHFMLYGNPQVSELYAQIKQTDGTNHYVKVMDLAGKLYSNNKEVAIKDDIPTTASEVNALPDTTKYGASIDLSINNTTYVVTAQLKDQDGNNLGTAKTIDLPLESVVVSGSYDSANKKVVLTLKDGSTIGFSVADLVSGLQSEITSTNKLSVNLISGLSTIATSGALKDATQDANNRTVTDAEKTTWNNKADYDDLKQYIPLANIQDDLTGGGSSSKVLSSRLGAELYNDIVKTQQDLETTNDTVSGHTTSIQGINKSISDIKSEYLKKVSFVEILDPSDENAKMLAITDQDGNMTTFDGNYSSRASRDASNLSTTNKASWKTALGYLSEYEIDQKIANSSGGTKIVWEVWE